MRTICCGERPLRDMAAEPRLVALLHVLGRAMLVQMVGDGGHIDVSDDLGSGVGRLDLDVGAAHVVAQHGRIAGVDKVGRGDALLLEDDVGAGRAVLEGREDGCGEARRFGDGAVGGGQVQAAGVSVRRRAGGEGAYSAVEKRKKGDVLRKASAEGSAARARAATSVGAMVRWGVMVAVRCAAGSSAARRPLETGCPCPAAAMTRFARP